MTKARESWRTRKACAHSQRVLIREAPWSAAAFCLFVVAGIDDAGFHPIVSNPAGISDPRYKHISKSRGNRVAAAVPSGRISKPLPPVTAAGTTRHPERKRQSAEHRLVVCAPGGVAL